MQIGSDSIIHISKLFSGIARYRIPLYQRRYVWDVENWETLWRDFTDLQEQIDTGKQDKKHFTGTIITLEKDGNWDIIDGQQRLTTFQVIFCVIRDLCVSKLYRCSVDSDFLQQIKRHIELSAIERGISRTETDELAEYRLIPRSHDREAFLSVVNSELGKLIKEESDINVVLEQFRSLAQQPDQNRIIAVYGYFGEKIIGYLMEKTEENVVTLQNLTNTLANNFHLIKIDLNNDVDEPEKVFETINDTGRMLDDFDYLRNHLFLRARKLESPSVIDLYQSYWKKFEQWTAKELELFFRTFLIAKLGPGCFESGRKPIKPFDCYQEYSNTLTVPSGTEKVEHEFMQLRSYADTYEQLDCSTSVAGDSNIRKCNIGSRMQFYEDLNLPRLDSFILFLKHSVGLDDPDLHNVCNILESYIVRRLLCYVGYKSSYERIRTDSYQKVNAFFSETTKNDKKFGIPIFAEFLSDTWPADPDQIRDALEEAFLHKNTNLILYILYRIELHIGTNPVGSSLCFKDFETIECIMLPEDLNFLQSEDYSIGNVTPIKSPACDNWASQPVSERMEILKRDNLNLTQDVCTNPNWNENNIRQKTEEISQSLQEIWRPASYYLNA